MQVFNAYLKIGYKRIPSILMYLIVFSVMAIVMSTYFVDSTTANFETTSLNVCIIDLDQSEASQALSDYLGDIHNIVPLENDIEVLLDNLYYRSADYILRIPSGFEDSLEEGNWENSLESIPIPNTYSSSFVDAQINSYLSTVALYLQSGYVLSDALIHTDLQYNGAVDSVTLKDAEEAGGSNETTATFYFQFIPYIMLSILITGMTPILTTFRKKDLDARIRCSSLSMFSRSFQIALGSTAYSLISWIVLVSIGFPLYGKYISGTTFMYLLMNSLVLLLLCLSITLFIGAFSPKETVLPMISNILSLGMSFICGIFVPLSLLGDKVVFVAQFLPFYWYVQNNNLIGSVSSEVFSATLFWRNIGMQLLFAITIFILSLVVTKHSLSKR